MYRVSNSEKPIKKVRGRIFFQLNIKPSDEFSVQSAYNAIYPIHSRKQFHRKSKKITFLLYPSKMELKHSSWFRQEKKKILYLDSILKFYVFKSMKEFLIFGVQSDMNTRCLLVLQIPVMDHLMGICETIEMQHAESGKEIHLEEDNHVEKKIKITEEKPHRHMIEETRPYNSEGRPLVFVKNTRDVQTETEEQDIREKMKWQESPATVTKGLPKWQEDVKFISYNSKFGNFVDDGGSVYMYTAQQIAPNDDAVTEHSFYECSSCSSSSNRDY